MSLDETNTDFLTLKERIELIQKRKIESNNPSIPVKRVHTISDSEESNCGKNDSEDEFELPLLESSSSVRKFPEVLLLSDSENEEEEKKRPISGQKSTKLQPVEKIPEVLLSDGENKLKDKQVSKRNLVIGECRNLQPVQKISEVLLTDSEDEFKEKQALERNFIFEESEKVCLHEEPKLYSNLVLEVPNIPKQSKSSPTKQLKDYDKEAAKQEKMKLKEAKRKEQELAKAIKQSEKELQKSKKPDECLKAMQVVIDHNLIMENGSEDIFRALDEGNIKYSIEENPINHSVVWCKKVVDVLVENNQIVKEEREEFENELVILIPNSSFIKMMHAFLMKSKGKDTSENDLSDYILNVSSFFPQMRLTCIIIGLEKYIKSLKENYTSSGEFKKNLKQISKLVIEESIIEVQLQIAVNFIFMDNMKEYGDMLFRFTKAIAEAPQKKEKQMQKDLAFSWYADGDSNCPVKLDKSKSSFLKLWQQQLQQFQNVGAETAEAICAMYSSPASLIQAYKQCATTKEAEKLLADIVVRRNYGPLGTQRRIGPELSYKIYLFFSSQDGNLILQR